MNEGERMERSTTVEEQKPVRKQYESPVLTLYGDLSALTGQEDDGFIEPFDAGSGWGP